MVAVEAKRQPHQRAANPLDEKMTKAQIARRNFKSSLRRKAPNTSMSKLGALAEMINLVDRFRGELLSQGVDPDTTQAALVYHWPDPAGTLIRLETTVLPAVEQIGAFVERIAALEDPQFLGVLFSQTDPQLPITSPYKVVGFVAQFISGSEAEGLLMIARDRQLKGIQNS
jgi:hypothetical protein